MAILKCSIIALSWLQELLDLEMDTYRNNIIRVLLLHYPFPCHSAVQMRLRDATLQLKVFLGACNLLAGTIWAISNIFGMNLGLLVDDLYGATHDKFVEVRVQQTNRIYHHDACLRSSETRLLLSRCQSSAVVARWC